MTRTPTALFLAAAALLAAIPAATADVHADHPTATVSIPAGSSAPGCETTNECNIPANVAIRVGGEVTWYNDDTAAHTVTSGTPNGEPDGLFDSGLFLPGSTFTFKFDESGTYPYFCIVHPWRIGTVTVTALQEPTGGGLPALHGEPGMIAVADASYGYNDRVQVFHPNGTLAFSIERPFTHNIAIGPNGRTVTSDPGAYLLSDTAHVTAFHPNGTLAFPIGSPGNGSGQFNRPGGVAIGPDGRIAVADRGNDRVQVFHPNGTLAFPIGSPGNGSGQFNRPGGVAIGPDGRIAVADRGNDRVQVFHPNGTLALSINSSHAGHDLFISPSDVAVGPDGRIVVVDRVRVTAFHPNGTLALSFIQPGNFVAVGPDGIIAVSGQYGYGGDRVVTMFHPNGTLALTIETSYSIDLWNPQGVAIGAVHRPPSAAAMPAPPPGQPPAPSSETCGAVLMPAELAFGHVRLDETSAAVSQEVRRTGTLPLAAVVITASHWTAVDGYAVGPANMTSVRVAGGASAGWTPLPGGAGVSVLSADGRSAAVEFRIDLRSNLLPQGETYELMSQAVTYTVSCSGPAAAQGMPSVSWANTTTGALTAVAVPPPPPVVVPQTVAPPVGQFGGGNCTCPPAPPVVVVPPAPPVAAPFGQEDPPRPPPPAPVVALPPPAPLNCTCPPAPGNGAALVNGDVNITGMLPDGTPVELMATWFERLRVMKLDIVFVDSEHVNYDIVAVQDGKTVLEDMGAHEHTGVGTHMTTPLVQDPSEFPLKVTVTFNGYGIDEITGQAGDVVFANNAADSGPPGAGPSVVAVLPNGTVAPVPGAGPPPYANVVIPPGSSVPGCEETNECNIPENVTIDVGGEVTWLSNGTAGHTITSGTPDGGPDGLFDSGLFLPGSTFTFKFDESGIYPYFCIVHPWRTGTVTVSDAWPADAAAGVVIDMAGLAGAGGPPLDGSASSTVTFPPSETSVVASFAAVTFPPGVTAAYVPADGRLALHVAVDLPDDSQVQGALAYEGSGRVTLQRVVEVGGASGRVTFDMPVRILLEGQAGGRAFYIEGGVGGGAITPIDQACAADDAARVHRHLGGAGECQVDSADGDKIIYTYHLTRFGTALPAGTAPPPVVHTCSASLGMPRLVMTDVRPGGISDPVRQTVINSGSAPFARVDLAATMWRAGPSQSADAPTPLPASATEISTVAAGGPYAALANETAVAHDPEGGGDESPLWFILNLTSHGDARGGTLVQEVTYQATCRVP